MDTQCHTHTLNTINISGQTDRQTDRQADRQTDRQTPGEKWEELPQKRMAESVLQDHTQTLGRDGGGDNFSFVAPSSEELWVCKELNFDQNALVHGFRPETKNVDSGKKKDTT